MADKTRSKAKEKSTATPKGDTELALRIVVVRPPRGVRFCLQRGRDEIVSPVDSTGADISFDLTVRMKDAGGERPRFLGPFAQGPADGRFVYVCSGTSAGQHDSCWTRRAKVHLSAMTWRQVRDALQRPGSRLEARIPGAAGDGGPSCATVPLLDSGWRVAPA